MAFDHLDPPLLGQGDHGLSCNAIEEAIGCWCVQSTVFDKKDVGTRALGNITPPVHHERIIVSRSLGLVFGNGTDHVEARSFGVNRGALRRRTLVFGPLQLDPCHSGLRIEVGTHVPTHHGNMRGRLLSGNCHHL